MMLVEEPTTNKPDEMPPGFSTILNDGAWEPMIAGIRVSRNTLTVRHNGKADVQYADGHTQPTHYKQAQDTNNVVAAF